MLAAAGVRLYKVGLSFRSRPTRMRAFARGLQEILVVEEKAPVVEAQLRDLFYNAPAHERPVIVGKHDAHGAPLVSALGELRPSRLIETRRALDRACTSRATARSATTCSTCATSRRPELLSQRRRRGQARAVLLRRLPAQHQHQGARRLARAGRHRLPLHGVVDGPRAPRA